MGQHDETGHATRTVRWPLQANLFVGPAPHFPDNHNLFPFSPTHDNVLAIDLSLGALNNPGLLADVN